MQRKIRTENVPLNMDQLERLGLNHGFVPLLIIVYLERRWQRTLTPATLCPGHACKRRGSHTPCRHAAIGSRVESISVSVQSHAWVTPSSSRPPLSVVR